MTDEALPGLARADRPAQARRVWLALIERTTDETPIIALGRTLALHRLYPPPVIESRMDDAGYLLEISLQSVVSEIWPAIAMGSGEQYDLNNPVHRHGYTFRQQMSQYLRGTVNAMCVRQGNLQRPSRWWVRTDWFECPPTKFVLSTFGPDEPDVPEAELIRLRHENASLRLENEKLSRRINTLAATLRAVGTE